MKFEKVYSAIQVELNLEEHRFKPCGCIHCIIFLIIGSTFMNLTKHSVGLLNLMMYKLKCRNIDNEFQTFFIVHKWIFKMVMLLKFHSYDLVDVTVQSREFSSTSI